MFQRIQIHYRHTIPKRSGPTGSISLRLAIFYSSLYMNIVNAKMTFHLSNLSVSLTGLHYQHNRGSRGFYGLRVLKGGKLLQSCVECHVAQSLKYCHKDHRTVHELFSWGILFKRFYDTCAMCIHRAKEGIFPESGSAAWRDRWYRFVQ